MAHSVRIRPAATKYTHGYTTILPNIVVSRKRTQGWRCGRTDAAGSEVHADGRPIHTLICSITEMGSANGTAQIQCSAIVYMKLTDLPVHSLPRCAEYQPQVVACIWINHLQTPREFIRPPTISGTWVNCMQPCLQKLVDL